MSTPERRVSPAAPRLRVLSFNIQVGMHTEHYGHYLSRAWRHVLPGGDSLLALNAIAELARGYDFVAIQEADAGSLRTRFLNQMEYLAQRAGFGWHGYTVTRDLQPIAQHCLGYLSRLPARVVDDHALPGAVPGRRALHVELETPGGPLALYVAHLALGRATQTRQLRHLAGLTRPEQPSVILGDLNCEPAQLREHPALRAAGFTLARHSPKTFPSWAPRRSIDHILLSPHLQMHDLQALPRSLSDHLPLSAEISLRAPVPLRTSA